MDISKLVSAAQNKMRFLRLLFTVNLLFFVLVPHAHGRDFTVKRSVKGYQMTVTLSQNPPILGKNDIKIEIRDSKGEPVTDASVIVNYFMPPMPGMPPMNYKIKAVHEDTEYQATMDLIMEGPWNITILAKVGGNRLKMTVLIDVR